MVWRPPIHGIWAAFWLAYGFLNFMIALKLIPAPVPHAAVPALGYWFFVLAAMTLIGMIALAGTAVERSPHRPVDRALERECRDQLGPSGRVLIGLR